MGANTLSQSTARAPDLKRIGIIVALPAEARCLSQRVPDPGTEITLDRQGRLRVCGIGPERARITAEAAMSAGAQALVSCGMAGGLDPALRAGAVVLADAVIDLGSGDRRETHTLWRGALQTRLPHARVGALLSVATAVTDTAEKVRLYAEQGAVAVDMESAAIAAVATRHDVPFVAVRSIVDAADIALPRAAAGALDPSGNPRPMRLALALLRRPAELPALVRLAACNRLAEAALRAVANALQDHWSLP